MKCSSALELHYYGHASTLVLVFGLAQIILFLVLIILHKSRRMRNFFHIRVSVGLNQQRGHGGDDTTCIHDYISL